MTLSLLVYAISFVGNLQALALITTGICGFVALTSLIIYATSSSDDIMFSWNKNADGSLKKEVIERRALHTKWLKRCVVAAAVSAAVLVITPSEKTAYIMLGAYAAQRMAESDRAQSIPKKVLTLIENKIDELIKESAK